MKNTPRPNDWVLDVSLEPPFAFCPYIEPGEVIIGMSVISARCPGNLVGVFHVDGWAAVNRWVDGNPTWYEDYRKEE